MPDTNPKTFYILDGHALIFRAYFAPFRNLTSPTGEPTKAPYVFTQWLFSLVEKCRPAYLAMTIDSGTAEGFRREIDPTYKANRESPPEDFHPQEQTIIQLVRDAGIPIFVKPGFEADDLIATIIRRLPPDFNAVIVSQDKDLRQLVTDRAVMYDLHKDTVLDAGAILQNYGYTPAQAIDLQTLIGDSTDNIKGIPGIGEKTAAKLLQTYGTLDNILAHAADLTPKLRQNLTEFAARLPIARQLVTLRTDVDFPFDPAQCLFTSLLTPALKSDMERLGFQNLLTRYAPKLPTPAPPPKENPRMAIRGLVPDNESLFPTTPDARRPTPDHYHLIQTPAQFADFLTELSKQPRFAFDTETDALGAMCSNLVGMSFSWQEKTGYYIPVQGPLGSMHLTPEQVLPKLRSILENPAIKKIGHNIKYDLLVMLQAGVHLRGIELDTMIAAFLLDAGRMTYGIDRLAFDLLQFKKIPTSDLIGSGKNQISMQQVDLQTIANYAAEDADIALRLANLLAPKLAQIPELQKLSDEIETPLIEVLAEMEQNGIAIDPETLRAQSRVIGQRIDALRDQIVQAAGVPFNPDSPKQLQEILFTQLKLPILKKIKTGASTDVEVLEKLADLHPVPKLMLDYRTLTKLKNTYLDNLTDYLNPRTGRIHASFNQIGAATGRLSCNDPNLQNIPIRTDEGSRIRSAFIAGDPKHNVLLSADYSQIEIRILAHFTQEPALVRALASNEDVHTTVAAEVFSVPAAQVTREQRAQAKVINFGIIYGITANGLSRRIEGMSRVAAQALIDSYNARFPNIQKFFDACVEQAHSLGYVQTILGRRRPLPDIRSAVFSQRTAAERQAINSVIQGSAADLIKAAMLKIHRRIEAEKRPSKMLLQVHDELVFETPAKSAESEADMIRHEMITALTLSVPLSVDIHWGKNWQEVK